MQARFPEAHQLLEQSKAESDGDDSQLWYIQYQEALLATDEGNIDDALKSLLKLVDVCQDDRIRLDTLNFLGWLCLSQGVWVAALAWFERACGMRACFWEGGVHLQMAASFAGAAAARLQMQPDACADLEEKASALLHSYPHQEADGVQVAMFCLASCKLLRRLPDKANTLFAKAFEVHSKIYAVTHPSNAMYQDKLLPHALSHGSVVGSAAAEQFTQKPSDQLVASVLMAAIVPPVDS